MPEVSPTAHALAQRVLLHDAGEHPEPAALAEAVERADARLRARLVDLVGLSGYTTLVDRAVRLAQTEVPALERVTVDAGATGGAGGAGGEGILRGVRDVVESARASGGDPRAAEAGLTAILAHIIGLLVIFIGEDLALRLVHEAWPEPAPDHVAPEGGV